MILKIVIFAVVSALCSIKHRRQTEVLDQVDEAEQFMFRKVRR